MKINQSQHGFAGIGRAMIQNQNQGLVKVYSEENGPIVGASVCGPAAGEMIHELMYMVGRPFPASVKWDLTGSPPEKLWKSMIGMRVRPSISCLECSNGDGGDEKPKTQARLMDASD